ncbi:lactonase family protein [Clostridium pasteurianum]|uniref:lactonase family protein n=1 Tax=Clostridium pasteurianum TaxID=1501 RepID=UPI0022608A3C|nr:lactonase family protein [Clostridium pasteurianum]UZW14822.1 lactonase family protein [Clostridium pasteurianum]
MDNKKYTAFVGTYTKAHSKGIYKFTLDENKPEIQNIECVAELGSPTYLTIFQNSEYLYSVIKDATSGGIASYKIDKLNTELKFLNSKLISGKPPCHVILNPENNYVFSGNYHKAELIAYPIDHRGSLKDPSDKILHRESGPNKSRQESAHIHFVNFTPDNKFLYTIDLGIDMLSLYKVVSGKFIEEPDKNLQLKPGCGPRHMDFHPKGNFAYIIAELTSEIITLAYNSSLGTFKDIQYISTLPSNCSVESTGGAVHISEDGRFLYASNRGHDSITVFKIDQLSGKLEFVLNTKLKGKTPRDFSLSPSSNFLVAANQSTNNIELYSIDRETGILKFLNISEYIPTPVCIKFL